MLISEALEGKYIKTYSSLRRGIIQEAILREDMYIRNKAILPFAVRVRPEFIEGKLPQPDFWSTYYVQIDGKDSE